MKNFIKRTNNNYLNQFKSQKLMKKAAFLMLMMLLVAWHGAHARQKEKDKQKDKTSATDQKAKLDSILNMEVKPVAYDKIVTNKAVVKKGLMNLIQVENKYYLEIPQNIMNKEILIVNRLAEGASGLNKLYAGDQINEVVVTLSMDTKKKNINISKRNYDVLGTKPGDEMYNNVQRSNQQPVNYVLSIKTTAPDSAKVIEITQLLKSDEDLFGFHPEIKKHVKLGSNNGEAFFVDTWNAFPNNLSFRLGRTYGGGGGAGAGGLLPGSLPIPGQESTGTFSLVLNSSWILLPENPMRMREYDNRVGYFYNVFVDYSYNPHGVKTRAMTNRWRLEPKPEDVQRYLAGELVEPAKPIIFYIDPTTPEKWIPYLIRGVNDWAKAFEKAGFKNAIVGKRAPTPAEDPTWSLEDARYSAIVYKPSKVINASGPNVNDPRTGEIMESHINWYHNVMKILENWPLAQIGAVYPRVRSYQMDDELMGRMIQFVCSHEVGHTLGLRHNFLASNSVPVEMLRNKAWVEKNGHTPSIMDYARFNYVAQPEDNIDTAGLFPRVNDYDEWAISWGYRWYGNLTEKNEKQKLDGLTSAAIKNPRLRWGATYELPGTPDPRAQLEDLGDNQMKANAYGIKNLQYVAAHLPEWKIKAGDDYEKLGESFQYGVLMQFVRYITHATTYIGGVYGDSYHASDGAPNNYSPAPVALQKEAISFLDRWALHSQNWLFNEAILGKFYNPAHRDAVDLQKKIIMPYLDELIGPEALVKMSLMNSRFGEKSYQLADYFKDVQNTIWAELNTGAKMDLYRLYVQNAYLEKMAALVMPPSANPLEFVKGLPVVGKVASEFIPAGANDGVLKALATVNIERLKTQVEGAIKGGKYTDALTSAHLKSALKQINRMLTAK